MKTHLLIHSSVTRWARYGVIVSVVLAGSASAAPTEEDLAEGRRLFEQGLRGYDTAEYDQAIESFRAAYERTHAPALLFNMAQAYRLKGDCQKAVDLYRRFINLDPASPDRERAQSRLVSLEPCQAPERPPGNTTLPAPASPVPALVLTQPETAEPARRSGFNASTAGTVLLAVALGTGAVGGYFSWQARSDSREISNLFERGGSWDAHAAEIDAHGRSAQSTAKTLFIVAGISAVLGLASHVYGWQRERSARAR